MNRVSKKWESSFKSTNVFYERVRKRRKNEEKILAKIITDNVWNVIKNINLYMQEA